MTLLADEKILLSKKGDLAFNKKEISEYQGKIPGWEVINENGLDKLQREYFFKDYLAILDLCHKIGMIAEQVNHHPVLHLEWGKLTVTWWTHVIGGLHKNDFIMAAKCDRAAMLRVASGEWRVASGEWRVASGEWRVASGEWRKK